VVVVVVLLRQGAVAVSRAPGVLPGLHPRMSGDLSRSATLALSDSCTPGFLGPPNLFLCSRPTQISPRFVGASSAPLGLPVRYRKSLKECHRLWFTLHNYYYHKSEEAFIGNLPVGGAHYHSLS